MNSLRRASALLEGRLAELEDRLAAGDESAWPAYCEAIRTLAVLVEQTAPGARGEFLTTKQLAERIGIAPKTLLRRRARGQVQPPLVLGKRGRAAIRWRGTEVAR